MGLRRHPLHVDADAAPLRDGFRLLLAIMLRFPLVVAEPANGGLRKGGKNQEKRKKDAKHV